tara:strand:- start:1238 stop:1975 length:738 start_codon:yes stop_codon:yes gene_type:complete
LQKRNNMILTAHQPVYLPWLGLFHKISLSDTYVFFDEVQYLPKDWMNRNYIKTKNGPTWLTVPVLRKGHRDLKTSEIKINNSMNWQQKHFSSIKLNYKKTTYYDNYISFFEEIYSKSWEYLSELNEYMLHWFLKELKIDVNFLRASDLDLEGKKSDLVLDMCKKLQASTYIFGSLGRNYANLSSFNENKIKVFFQEYIHPNYSQGNGEFIPNMSIIDLLFNCGPKSSEVILSNNVSYDELKNMNI